MNRQEEEMMKDAEQGHWDIDAMLQKYIGKMFGSLEDASIKYFLETGKINGNFRLNLVRMVFETHYNLLSKEISEKNLEIVRLKLLIKMMWMKEISLGIDWQLFKNTHQL